VRVIDGTGKAAVDDQNVVIEGGKIVMVRPEQTLPQAMV
jgi:hypothetical protein